MLGEAASTARSASDAEDFNHVNTGHLTPNRKTVEYTPGPWRIMEDTLSSTWVIVRESSARGSFPIARIPEALVRDESRANAHLITQAPEMHRAAVKLMCAWGTEDAKDAMAELARILSKAVRS